MANMRTIAPLLLSVAFATPVFAQAPKADAKPSKVDPESPLIVDGAITVDAGDIDAYLLRVPPERRNDVKTSYDRVVNIADGVFVPRSIAARAKAAGLDKDPIVQRRLQQVQDSVLADLYMQKLDRDAVAVNLEQRARELYLADQAKFVKPESVSIQHILIDTKGRTQEMALEKARDIYERATSGKEDFLALAGRYSDDPDKKRNGGDLGASAPGSFVAPVRDAIARMKTQGEISPPIESEFGYHVVRFMGRTPQEKLKFEDVKEGLIKAESERLQKQRFEGLIQDVRSSPTVVTNRANVEALVVPIDREAVRRAHDAAAAAAAADAKKPAK
jgi:hypothetical protein